MAVVDIASRCVTIKVVYYGCALGGKTTNLLTLHRLTDPDAHQGMVSIATNDDRTLFFDLLPVDLGQIGGLHVKVKVYTVPGQVHYELTRRQVLGGADGVVFVADSSPEAAKSNAWAIENLRFNLKEQKLDPDHTPTVLQYNKRDLPNARPIVELEHELNRRGLPHTEAVAKTGVGVVETFAEILKRSITVAWARTGRGSSQDAHIAEKVDQALAAARARTPAAGVGAGPRNDFERRFDMDAYRDSEADRGRDRHVVDQESLLSESVQANMMLAERLEGLRRANELGARRGEMMEALARLAPMLADTTSEALPMGSLEVMLHGAKRAAGTLFLSKPSEHTLIEREALPAARPDPLNSINADGLGSLAFRLAQTTCVRVIEDLVGDVFFSEVPPSCQTIGSLLIAPLACDGLTFGAVFVYGRFDEPGFDETEQKFWAAASSLYGLALHWRALRRKMLETQSR